MAVLISLVAIGALGLHSRPGRAVLLVADLFVQSPRSALLLLTRSSSQDTLTIQSGGRSIEGRIFRPAGSGAHPAVILSAGYAPDLSDALLNRTADDLARLGWIVLIPSTPRLREGLLSPEDVDVLVAAFQWLTQRSDVNPGRVGYAGFCVGSSLALVAAADPRINEQVAYVHTFGGYCDAASELRAIATGSTQSSSGDQPWQPAPGALTLYIQNLLTHVESPADREQIEAAISRGDTMVPEGLTALDTQIAGLLLTEEPTHIDALLADLPAAQQAYLRSISPCYVADQLKAKVFLMHDVDDPYVPSGEADRLVTALPATVHPQLDYFTIFNHVRPERARDLLTMIKEAVRLIGHLARAFAAMD